MDRIEELSDFGQSEIERKMKSRGHPLWCGNLLFQRKSHARTSSGDRRMRFVIGPILGTDAGTPGNTVNEPRRTMTAVQPFGGSRGHRAGHPGGNRSTSLARSVLK